MFDRLNQAKNGFIQGVKSIPWSITLFSAATVGIYKSVYIPRPYSFNDYPTYVLSLLLQDLLCGGIAPSVVVGFYNALIAFGSKEDKTVQRICLFADQAQGLSEEKKALLMRL